METRKIPIQAITRLPVKEIAKSDGPGEAIIVSTPHKGDICIDYKNETGFFTKKLVDKRITDIISRVYELENEAKEFLLAKWISETTPFTPKA